MIACQWISHLRYIYRSLIKARFVYAAFSKMDDPHSNRQSGCLKQHRIGSSGNLKPQQSCVPKCYPFYTIVQSFYFAEVHIIQTLLLSLKIVTDIRNHIVASSNENLIVPQYFLPEKRLILTKPLNQPPEPLLTINQDIFFGQERLHRIVKVVKNTASFFCKKYQGFRLWYPQFREYNTCSLY